MESSGPSPDTDQAPMVPLNPKDQSASPTLTVNLSTSNSSLMLPVTNQNPPLSPLPQLSPTKFPNSSLTRSHSLQLTHKAPKRHTLKYFSSFPVQQNLMLSCNMTTKNEPTTSYHSRINDVNSY